MTDPAAIIEGYLLITILTVYYSSKSFEILQFLQILCLSEFKLNLFEFLNRQNKASQEVMISIFTIFQTKTLQDAGR